MNCIRTQTLTDHRRPSRRFIELSLAIVAVFAFAPERSAAADTEGLVLGLDLLSSHFGTEDNADPADFIVDDLGGGASLFIGWGFGPSFPVRLSIAGATHETSDPEIDVAYGSVTIDGMYLFRNPEPMRPYLYGGVGGFALRSQKDALDWEVSGPGVVVGGGVFYFVGESFALDFSVRGEFVNWETATATLETASGDLTVEVPIQEEGRAAKVLLGVSWWL